MTDVPWLLPSPTPRGIIIDGSDENENADNSIRVNPASDVEGDPVELHPRFKISLIDHGNRFRNTCAQEEQRFFAASHQSVS
jgi:hypothetical protein